MLKSKVQNEMLRMVGVMKVEDWHGNANQGNDR